MLLIIFTRIGLVFWSSGLGVKNGDVFAASLPLRTQILLLATLLLRFVFVHRTLNGDARNGRLGV